MNQRDDREWPDVERRKEERREVGPPQHVMVDGLSNGARLLMERAIMAGENAVDEAKRTRRWVVSALVAVGGFLIVAGEFRGKVQSAIDIRPTDAAVLQMFTERDSALISVIHEQQITIEVIGERQKANTRRLDLTEAELERIKRRIE